MFNRVAEFHRAFGHPIGTEPDFPDQAIRDLRMRLIEEELEEYCEAFACNDRIEMADALADLLYVLAGTAVAYGIAPQETVLSPYEGVSPPTKDVEAYDMFLREDFWNYQQAEQDNDLDAVAKTIVHMMVEIFGIAYRSNIPINEVFSEVHRSNMSKLGEDGRPILREDGKVLKSKLFTPPNIAAILEHHD